jgi:hypothetical protein
MFTICQSLSSHLAFDNPKRSAGCWVNVLQYSGKYLYFIRASAAEITLFLLLDVLLSQSSQVLNATHGSCSALNAKDTEK